MICEIILVTGLCHLCMVRCMWLESYSCPPLCDAMAGVDRVLQLGNMYAAGMC